MQVYSHIKKYINLAFFSCDFSYLNYQKIRIGMQYYLYLKKNCFIPISKSALVVIKTIRSLFCSVICRIDTKKLSSNIILLLLSTVSIC